MTTYPFVQSYVDLGVAKGPRLAMCWHMAEGGGTVGYLAKPNPNGVSVHFVIEYTGRIVQMLKLDHMHSSIRTSDIRTTDDTTPPYYGATAARAVMGDWARTVKTLGPNHASIGVEVEGFAKDGPNSKQSIAIDNLAGDMASRFSSIKGQLGHRDFADYKQCPGKSFPWGLIGGHGVGAEENVTITQVKGEDWKAKNGILRAEPDTSAATLVTLPVGTIVRSIAEVASAGSAYSWRLTEYQGKPAYFVYKRLADGVVPDFDPVPSPGVDAELTAYIARQPAPGGDVKHAVVLRVDNSVVYQGDV